MGSCCYVLVAGAARSGTTLLGNILASHPSAPLSIAESRLIDVVPECIAGTANPDAECGHRAVFGRIADLAVQATQNHVAEASDLSRSLAACAEKIETGLAQREIFQTYSDAIHAVWNHLQRCGRTGFIIDKTTAWWIHEDLLDAVLNAKVVFLHRNPRDIAVTHAKLNQSSTDGDEVRSEIIRSVLYWRRFALTADYLRRKYPDRVCSIHYENLVLDPQGTIRSVFEFCDLEALTEPDLRALITNVTGHPSYDAGKAVRLGISTNALDRWCGRLSPVVLEMIANLLMLSGRQGERYRNDKDVFKLRRLPVNPIVLAELVLPTSLLIALKFKMGSALRRIEGLR